MHKVNHTMYTAIAMLLAFGRSSNAATEEIKPTNLGTLIARTPAMAEPFPSDDFLAVAAQLFSTPQPTHGGVSYLKGGGAVAAAVRTLASKRPRPPLVALLLETSIYDAKPLRSRSADDLVFLAPQVELRHSLNDNFRSDSLSNDDNLGDDKSGNMASNVGGLFDLASNALQSLRMLRAMESKSMKTKRDRMTGSDRNAVNNNEIENSGSDSDSKSSTNDSINSTSAMSVSSLCVLWLHPELEPRVAAEAAAAANAAVRLRPGTYSSDGEVGACGQIIGSSIGSSGHSSSSASSASSAANGSLKWRLLHPGHLLVITALYFLLTSSASKLHQSSLFLFFILFSLQTMQCFIQIV